jgi:hypothetical protein
MAAWQPLKRRDFIRKLRALGFDGPFPPFDHVISLASRRGQR